MKKFVFVIVVFLLLVCQVYADGGGTSKIIIDGVALNFDNDSGYPFVDDAGRLQVPVRRFAESTQSIVTWDSTSKIVTVKKNNSVINIPLGKNYLNKDGVNAYFDTVSVIKNGRIYLPLRAVGESLGYRVSWSSTTLTADLSTIIKNTIQPINNIPLNSYKVYYYNTNEPTKVIAEDTVDFIGINSSETIHGIPSNDLGVAWIGDLEFSEDITKKIDIVQSWSTVKLQIDGVKVQSDTYLFTKGKHRIEVDFENNWHTIDFMLQFVDADPIIERSELLNKINNLLSKSMSLEYVGIYESDDSQHIINVDVKSTSKPTVLVLVSFSSVNWHVNNSNQDNIKAIIFSSYTGTGKVELNGKPTVPIYRLTDLEIAYTILPTSFEVNDKYYFQNFEFDLVRKQMMELFGKKLSGFTGAYSASKVSVPDMVMDPANTKKIDDAYAKMYRIQSEQSK